MEGIVKNITDYGAFIDLGGVDGLLHITDISWGRVNHPSELFAVGDKINVKVIKFNREDGRVSLATSSSRRSVAACRHALPEEHPGAGQGRQPDRLRRLRRMEPGIEGLIHISEMTWNKRLKHPPR